MVVEDADDLLERIRSIIRVLVALQPVAREVDLRDHVGQRRAEVVQARSAILGSLVSALTFSIDTANAVFTYAVGTHHSIDFVFVLVKKVLDLILCVLDIAKLSFNFGAVALSLEASPIELRDLGTVLNKLPIPCLDFLG